ncbi:MAG: radical SAM protein [Candidatus Marinimicrobia bacterium]|nr:radical SAM protein [Candidatus Neomarinimicrobiota bacterium]
MKHLIFGAQYIIGHHLFNKNRPLICGLTVTNKCNLNCRHCRIPDRGTRHISYKEAISAIEAFYNNGGRTLYLQGGEPFIWSDGDYRLDDIVKYSHSIGYLTTIIYTNGTLPLQTEADTVFISLDGLEKTHDYLRGITFNRIIKHINESDHPSLYANFTINNQNKTDIKDFCEYINDLDAIKGIFFYFHTPYYGYDDLYIETEERKEILRDLLFYKKKYKILNSKAGLKSALRNDWNRPLSICQIYEQGITYECCRYPGDPDLCDNCGYLSYAEIDQTLKLKPSSIMNAIKYF